MDSHADVPDYVAHVSEDGARYEAVCDHLREVAEMAADFARPFAAEEWAYAAGMAHDIGKYSKEFQRRILENGRKVDHSTAGAEVLMDEGLAPLSYCVAGHHGGLPDGGTGADLSGTLIGRLRKAECGGIPDYHAFQSEVSVPKPSENIAGFFRRSGGNNLKDAASADYVAFRESFFIRMVFSCLVDADYLCTERFMRGEERAGLAYDDVFTLRDRLEEKLAPFYPPTKPINVARCGLLDDCLDGARLQPGVFTLTAPTGSGKTYALMRFALNHACAPGHGMRRVIVAEPYTSIIEQNADKYRAFLGDHNILEHHMNFDFDDVDVSSGDGDLGAKLRLASENWDAPIVVTTNVQLLESLFSNRTSRCRKLHNIAGSVIVLDEAQMIPRDYIRPCVKALAELVRSYGCTVVLCTATQPALDEFFEEEGMTIQELCSDPEQLSSDLSRVSCRVLGKLEDDAVVDRLKKESAALCIVNNRKQARRLYELLSDEATDERPVFHLTTLMYPEHRRRVLADVAHRVSELRKPCLVVATSLVEAGVDLDFPVVYRALTGIDSLVQAAGRCNREFRRSREESMVYVFGSSYNVPAEIETRASIARTMLGNKKGADVGLDLENPGLVKAFFKNLYGGDPARLDAERILPLISSCGRQDGVLSIPFRVVSDKFKLIAEGSSSVVIPVDEVAEALCRAREGAAGRGDMRRLSRYSVPIYEYDVKNLMGAGALEMIGEDLFVLTDVERYREGTGLDVAVEGGEGVFL